LPHFYPVSTSIRIDYIIVGQGIAGSAVALQALKAEKKILVIDQPEKNYSSRIAAGLFNPVTGQNSVKTWLADQLFPYLDKFYREAETLIGQRFFFPMNLYKPFTSIHEQNEWMGKSADEMYADYISEIRTQPFDDGLHDPFGGMVLKQTGYLNTESYLKAVRECLSERAHFLNQEFLENELVIHENEVQYGDYCASHLILCQGVSGASTERFKKLAIRPLKGETLTIKSNWKKDVMVNRGVYMVPGNVAGQFRVGATYRFNDTSTTPTEEGRNEIEAKLKSFLALPYEIVSQDWGVRPTTVDRKPILGNDPNFERVVVFNGLGTKGVSLAPYFSDVLLRWLENRGALSKDIALSRFK
jgi:glycine oxidase